MLDETEIAIRFRDNIDQGFRRRGTILRRLRIGLDTSHDDLSLRQMMQLRKQCVHHHPACRSTRTAVERLLQSRIIEVGEEGRFRQVRADEIRLPTEGPHRLNMLLRHPAIQTAMIRHRRIEEDAQRRIPQLLCLEIRVEGPEIRTVTEVADQDPIEMDVIFAQCLEPLFHHRPESCTGYVREGRMVTEHRGRNRAGAELKC